MSSNPTARCPTAESTARWTPASTPAWTARCRTPAPTPASWTPARTFRTIPRPTDPLERGLHAAKGFAAEIDRTAYEPLWAVRVDAAHVRAVFVLVAAIAAAVAVRGARRSNSAAAVS